jgi:hypothetical protein
MQQKPSSIVTQILPRIQDAIFIGIFIAIATQGSALLNGDGDLGRHITIGNYIIHTWKIPTRDLFSHTMTGQSLVPHEWLAQLIFAAAHTFSKLTGVVWVIALLIATTFTLTYQEMLRRNVFRFLAILVAILAAFTSSLHWLARPHIFTFLFTALWAYQLENKKSKVWLFPLIMWIWANTHGAFIAGFVIWGAHVAGWLWEYFHHQSTKEEGVRIAIIGITSFAITFLNPAGWRLWETSLGYIGTQYLTDHTVEYQSPNFHNWSTWPFLLMLALGILGMGLNKRLRPREVLLFAGWTVMSLYSARNIPLFAIVVAPYIGTTAQAIIEKIPILQSLDHRISTIENSLKGIPWVSLLAMLILSIFFYVKPPPANQFDPNKFPVQAVDWLSEHPQDGRMFNNFIWGGYLLYRMWPQQQVFIDGQTDFYGEALTREYAKVMYLEEGWQATLAKYDITWVIVPSSGPFVEALQDQMGWTIVYRDGTTDIIRKP